MIALVFLIVAFPIGICVLFLRILRGLLRFGASRPRETVTPPSPAPQLASGRGVLVFALFAAPLAIGAILYAAIAPSLQPTSEQPLALTAAVNGRPTTVFRPATQANDVSSEPQHDAELSVADSSVSSVEQPEAPAETTKPIEHPTPEVREWTDSSGKFHRSASLADFQNGIAYLKESSGRIVHLSLDRLSFGDRAYIREATPSVTVITGKVAGITDGDTLTLLDSDKKQIKVRLEGIDAPESHQAYGSAARQALSKHVFQKSVVVESHGLDKYGRTLGHVFVDGNWVNQELVKGGFAWHYREYSKSEVLADAESQARTAHAGLWHDIEPIAPWDFRHREEGTAPGSRPGRPASTIVSQPVDSGTVTKKSLPDRLPSPRPESATTYVDRNPYDETVTGHTATGIPTYTGPRGGHYHYSSSGKKVYERKKK